MCRQWRCWSGRALGMAGPGRHCSTVMSPLPVGGGERRRGEYGTAGEHTDQQNCLTKDKKKSRSTIAGVSPESKPPQLTQLCVIIVFFFFYKTTKQINEPGGSVTTELESTADRCRSEKWRNLYIQDIKQVPKLLSIKYVLGLTQTWGRISTLTGTKPCVCHAWISPCSPRSAFGP